MPKRTLSTFLKTAHDVLDPVSWDIFKNNMKLITAGTPKMASVGVSVRVPGAWLPGVRKEIMRAAKLWAAEISKEGPVTSLYLRVLPASAASTYDILGNQKKISKMHTDE